MNRPWRMKDATEVMIPTHVGPRNIKPHMTKASTPYAVVLAPAFSHFIFLPNRMSRTLNAMKQP